MCEFKLRLADINISVSTVYLSTREFCREYISDFETPDLSVKVTPGDVAAENMRAVRERELEGLPPCKHKPEYLETLALYRKLADSLIDFGVILFHGSAVCMDGEVYLFTAKSGTGKSTHTRLWREAFGERAVMVNDDKPLIAVRDGEAIVYGTPWNGKHRLGTNMSAPLSAICILERAENNTVKELTPMLEFPKILSQTYRNQEPEFMQKTLALLDKLLHTVRLFRLGCNMEPEAALVSYNGMKRKDK